jgi:FG-GAP-like repeat
MKTCRRPKPPILVWVSIFAAAACARSRVVPSADRGDAAALEVDSGVLSKQSDSTAPRAVAPLSGGVVTSPHVLFRWTPRTSARVELASTPTSPVQTLGSGSGELDVPAVAVGRWFWRVVDVNGHASPFARLRVIPAATRLVRQGARGGTDLNGDSFDDVVLRQDVFAGRAKIDGSDRTSDVTIPLLPDTSSRCDERPKNYPPVGPRCRNVGDLYAPGDVDGDGFDDLLAYVDARCVLVFRGAASLPSPWHATEHVCPEGVDAPGPARIIRAGDVNGDGMADVGLAVTGGGLGVFLGRATGFSQQPHVLLPQAYQWADGGDLNGDGYDDLAALSKEGELTIFWGSAAGLTTTPGARLKVASALQDGTSALAAAPLMRVVDWDGDGLADVIGVAPSVAPEFWVVPGSAITSSPHSTRSRRWPFKNGFSESVFIWDVFPTAGRSTSAVLLGGWGNQGAWDMARVKFKEGPGFTLPMGPEHLEDARIAKPVAIASVGDVDGDGLDDALVVTVDDTDGSLVGELTLGTATGIDLGGAAYSLRYDGEREGAAAIGYLPAKRGSKARAP